MSAPGDMPPDGEAARRRRSLAIALALGAFVLLVFVVTIVRLGGNAAAPGY
ncbi:MAG: hypothetical protein H6923_03895 [Alphaproteobacteria bacterium]|nr:hypothetical protein [Alphaproteobacteria bacterium]